jgi:PKMT, C-terminal winged helix domain
VSASPDEYSEAPEVFRAAQGEQLTTGRPLTKAAMMALQQNVPAAIGFDELCGLAQARLGAHHVASGDDRKALASDMLQCFAAGVVELHSIQLPFVIQAGARPVASAVAALQAGRGTQVTNLRHESIAIDDEARRLLPMLTGHRTEQELATLAWPGEPEQVALGKLRQALLRLGRRALLAG